MMKMETKTRQVQELFGRMGEAWNNADGESFGQCFTADADYVTFNGQHLKGREAIAVVHQKLFDGVLRGSVLIGGTQTIRWVGPELAFVHGTGAVKLRWQRKAPTNRMSINTNVVLLEDAEWRVAAFHNCRIQEPNFIQRWLMSRS